MGTWGTGTLESDDALDCQARLAVLAGIGDASVPFRGADPERRARLEASLPRLLAFVADGGVTAERLVDEPPEFAMQLASWAEFNDDWAVLAVTLMGQGCALSNAQHAQVQAGLNTHRYLTDRATVDDAARLEGSAPQVEQALAFVAAAVAEKTRVIAVFERYQCGGGEPWSCDSADVPPRAQDQC